MAMTSAERQARYRERVRIRAGEGLEAAAERVRQEILAEWIREAQDRESYHGDDQDAGEIAAREVAFLTRVAARPLWHRQGFADWLETLIAYECERDINEARKEEKREASKRRRRRRECYRSDAMT